MRLLRAASRWRRRQARSTCPKRHPSSATVSQIHITATLRDYAASLCSGPFPEREGEGCPFTPEEGLVTAARASAALAHGRLWLRGRAAAAALGLHLPAVAVRGRRVARRDRADRQYRACLHPEVPVGAAARPGPAARRAGAVRPAARVAARCAAGIGRSLRAPRNLPSGDRPHGRDRGGGVGGVPVGEPGHPGGCVAHRKLPAAHAGRGHGRLCVGLPDGAAGIRGRRHQRGRPPGLAWIAARRSPR